MDNEKIDISWEGAYERIEEWIEQLVNHLPNIVLALLVFALSYALSRIIPNFLQKLIKNKIRKPSILNFLTSILTILIISVGLFFSLAILNLDKLLTSLLAGAGVIGLAVGLALQGTLSNFFSGVYLAVQDVINIGDFIETNGYTGTVKEITLRNTLLSGVDNNIVTIPNKTIIDNPFINYGLTGRMRILVKCGVHYNSNLETVKQIVLATINNDYPPIDEETIDFHYLNFGESSIDFQVRFWADATDKTKLFEAKSTAIMSIKRAFDKNGIIIPFPIVTVEKSFSE